MSWCSAWHTCTTSFDPTQPTTTRLERTARYARTARPTGPYRRSDGLLPANSRRPAPPLCPDAVLGTHSTSLTYRHFSQRLGRGHQPEPFPLRILPGDSHQLRQEFLFPFHRNTLFKSLKERRFSTCRQRRSGGIGFFPPFFAFLFGISPSRLRSRLPAPPVSPASA